ncbi:MAG: hypothetical protein E7113_04180 [Bacteroidales bacterium]|nr:hypothetical protein [Bacteroidales bacterium]
MKRFLLILLVLVSFPTLAQESIINVFLGSRDVPVSIYAGPVGNEPITQICESTETDRWNSILIKGKSAHRFNVDIYTQEDKYIPDVWIDRSECAVYANFWYDWDKWCLYDSPDIGYPCASFDTANLEYDVSFLYILDYVVINSYTTWFNVGFMYKGKYYEGWTKDVCRDINHSCH